MGETVVLVTVTGNKSARPGVDFLPLTCEYIEKMYAGGRIPGGYFKREARPGPAEILNCRLSTDRCDLCFRSIGAQKL